jgi:superfamily I DNA/RNA helicase
VEPRRPGRLSDRVTNRWVTAGKPSKRHAFPEFRSSGTIRSAPEQIVPHRLRVTQRPNGLFLTGDPVQKVYAKQHDMQRAGIDVRGRSSTLKTNYRNTRQILQAAFTILQKYRPLSPVPPAEVLEPDYAFRDGPPPTLYECADRNEQTRLVLWHLKSLGAPQLDGVCICSNVETTLTTFASECERQGIPTSRIDSTSTVKSAMGRGVKLVMMRDIKGYEFAHVFLVDLMDRYLLPMGMPWEERWRVAFQIYVAMTRARDSLVMSYMFNPSILLSPLKDTVHDMRASELIGQ